MSILPISTQKLLHSVKILLTIFLCSFVFFATAQQTGSVNGIVQDSTGLSVIAASVRLKSPTDSFQTNTDVNGKFTFSNVKGKSFTISIESLGYKTISRTYTFGNGQHLMALKPILLKESSTMLDEVTIEGEPKVTIKEDTIEYRIKDLRLREGALAEDALKKLDGVQVDKDGNVTAQGEQVTRVRINGKDYFGGDVKTATQNLPANIIEKMQIVDDYGDMANITGNRTGDPERVLNIELAPGMNKGDLGNIKAGVGNEDRYQATAMYRRMDDKQSFSVLGNMNNVNASLFDFNIRGGGARRMPGGGGYGRGSRMGGGGGSFGPGGFAGGSDGLTNTQSIGFDYRNDFSKKLSMYGTYSYSHNNNRSLNTTITNWTFPDSLVYQDNESNSQTIGNNHRFDWNVEWKPDSVNYVKISPTFSFGKNNSNQLNDINEKLNGIPSNGRSLNTLNSSKNPSYGGSALFNHRLNAKGRNIFVNFSLNSNATDQDQDLITRTAKYESTNPDSAYQRQLVDLRNKGLNGGTTLSYTEPVGKFSTMELTYDYNFANYKNNRDGYSAYATGDQLAYNDSLSNDYKYSFITNRVGLTYRFRNNNYNYSIGAAVQPNVLKGNTVIDGEKQSFHRSGFNFMPIARFEYKFSRSRSFNVNYTGSSNEPSFSQLQPINDRSNPNSIVVGNPDLSAAFTHNLRIRYNNFDWNSGNVLFTNLDITMTQDKIVSDRSSYLDPKLGLVQTTRYRNAGGYYTARGFYNYSKPFSDRKYTLTFRGMANYNNNVSFTNSQKNIARNWILNQAVNFRINPTELIEITPEIGYTYNTTANTLQSSQSSNISTWAFTLNSAVNIFQTLTWGVDFSKTTNNGYNSNVGANPMIINTYLEKQFFAGKKGAVRFTGFDLLNEQTSVSRTITDNSIVDSRANRLARYFMITLSYRFQNFPGGGNMDERQNRGDWGHGGGPGGQSGGGGRESSGRPF
ncbi:CarboxypepD_reg-like domain-containing protein [bacterium A37T11]|nr:CarboxypepD_reg-like domain-containing protein [bacterium A37T11]